MKHNSPFYPGVWQLLVFPSLMLPFVLLFQWHPIEQKIADSVQTALKEEHSWATIESFNRGRDLLLLGETSNEHSVNDALSIAGNVQGVRSVEFGGSIVPLTPSEPELTIELLADEVILSGSLGSQQQIDDTVTAATQKFADLKVVNRLSLDVRHEPVTPWSRIISSSDNLGQGISMSVVGDALTLKGEIASLQQSELLETQIRATFAGTLVNQIVVVSPKISCESLINETLANSRINFDIAKSSIRPESDALIEKLAKVANQCPSKNFEVIGHTDNSGSLEKNMSLSELRAQALVDRLIGLGLAMDRFTAKGQGPNFPIADNDTTAGRTANRRIEFKVIN